MVESAAGELGLPPIDPVSTWFHEMPGGMIRFTYLERDGTAIEILQAPSMPQTS
jgi:hypothetical protein